MSSRHETCPLCKGDIYPDFAAGSYKPEGEKFSVMICVHCENKFKKGTP